MPRKKFTEAQIALVVRELDNGAPVAELCRKLGVSDVALYNGKQKYVGMGTPEIRRLRHLEEENAKLKQLVADLTLDKVMLQEVLERWGMDFMTDTWVNGRRFRLLTVIDLYSRECVLLAADFSLKAPKVVAALEHLRQRGRRPQAITVENGSEFVSKEIKTQTYLRQVQLDFIRPGRPVENASSESFNGKLRDECINAHFFFSLRDVQYALALWREEYNTLRPHLSLGGLLSGEFRSQLTTEGPMPTFSTIPWS